MFCMFWVEVRCWVFEMLSMKVFSSVRIISRKIVEVRVKLWVVFMVCYL